MSFQCTQTWKRTAFALTCSLVCASAGLAFADAASDARKNIQAFYDAESVAISKHDVNATFRSYAPDYVSINEKGEKKNLEQTKDAAKSVMISMKTLTITQKVQTLTLKKSNQATVVVKNHISGVTIGDAKTSQKMSGDETAEDLWIKTGSGWLRKRSKTLSMTMTTNGVPIGK